MLYFIYLCEINLFYSAYKDKHILYNLKNNRLIFKILFSFKGFYLIFDKLRSFQIDLFLVISNN